MPTDTPLDKINKDIIHDTIEDILSRRTVDSLLFAIQVLYECLVVWCSLLDSDRGKASYYALSKKAGSFATDLRGARNVIAHNYFNKDEVWYSVIQMAEGSTICEIFRRVRLKELMPKAKEFEKAILLVFSNDSQESEDLHEVDEEFDKRVRFLVDTIPPALRGKYPEDSLESVIYYYYDLVREGRL